MSLEKIKRNGVLEAIRKAGLSPEDFRWEQSGGDEILNHPPSCSRFTFGGVAGRYTVRYVAGDGPETSLPKYTWDGVMESVKVWLFGVKTDVDMPDLWADLQGLGKMLGADPGSVENTPFSREEKAEISRQLRELKELAVRTFALSAENSAALEETLAYLDEAARRVGRVDWRNVFVGALIGYLMAAALSPDTARGLFELFLQGVGRLMLSD